VFSDWANVRERLDAADPYSTKRLSGMNGLIGITDGDKKPGPGPEPLPVHEDVVASITGEL
jgi:hypothetical protein